MGLVRVATSHGDSRSGCSDGKRAAPALCQGRQSKRLTSGQGSSGRAALRHWGSSSAFSAGALRVSGQLSSHPSSCSCPQQAGRIHLSVFEFLLLSRWGL